MIANRDFSSYENTSPQVVVAVAVPAVSSPVFKSAVLACLYEKGIKPHEMSLRSLKYSLRVPTRNKPTAMILVTFLKRTGLVTYEPTSQEIEWENFLSKLPTQEKTQASNFEAAQTKANFKLYGNSLNASDQPIAGWYGHHYNVVNDF